MDTTQSLQTKVPSPLTPSDDDILLHAGRIVSEAVYWEKYYELSEVSYEWNNGVLEEKPVSTHLTVWMFDWFCQLLAHFLNTHPIAKTVGLETGGKFVLPHKTAIRKPDLGVVLNANPIPLVGTDNSYKGTFDICIEALSVSAKKETERDTITKKGEYQLAGVKEYYLIDSTGKEMVFYWLNAQGHYQKLEMDKDGVIHSKALPGFRFRMADLYRQTDFEDLVDDAVYDFVLPTLRLAKAKALQEKTRAEQEKIRADEAQKQLELERARIERLEAELARYKKAFDN